MFMLNTRPSQYGLTLLGSWITFFLILRLSFWITCLCMAHIFLLAHFYVLQINDALILFFLVSWLKFFDYLSALVIISLVDKVLLWYIFTGVGFKKFHDYPFLLKAFKNILYEFNFVLGSGIAIRIRRLLVETSHMLPWA